MKKIKIISTISLLDGPLESKNIDSEALIFDMNKIEVLNCFTSIEEFMNQLISHEFIGDYTENKKDQFDKFNAKILHTNWFNFNEKRKIATEILFNGVINDKSERNKVEEYLKKVMSFRNSLAHGLFVTNGVISKLKYYEGEYKEVDLNDEYWKKVKEVFIYVFNLLRQTLMEKKIIVNK